MKLTTDFILGFEVNKVIPFCFLIFKLYNLLSNVKLPLKLTLFLVLSM